MLTIISFQLLPLKEVGAIFYGNQMVEEICNAADADGKSTEGSEDLKKSDLFYHGMSISIGFEQGVEVNANPAAKDYISRLADDIPTPPPLHLLSI
ncbi:MAG: hypothetical protein RLZZ557_76 [Bacteroidota bacterium]